MHTARTSAASLQLASLAHNCIQQSSGQARYRRSTAGYKVREKTKAEPLEQLRSHLRLLQLRSTATMNRRSTMTNLRLATFQTQRSNFDAAIKLAFTGFLRTAELTCKPKNLESDSPPAVFEHTKLQQRDVTFNHGQRRAFRGSTPLEQVRLCPHRRQNHGRK